MASGFDAGHCSDDSVQLSQLIGRSVLAAVIMQCPVAVTDASKIKNSDVDLVVELTPCARAFHVVIIRDRSLMYNTHDIRSVGACETVQDTRYARSVWPVELRVRAFLILSDRAKTSQMDGVGPRLPPEWSGLQNRA